MEWSTLTEHMETLFSCAIRWIAIITSKPLVHAGSQYRFSQTPSASGNPSMSVVASSCTTEYDFNYSSKSGFEAVPMD